MCVKISESHHDDGNWGPFCQMNWREPQYGPCCLAQYFPNNPTRLGNNTEVGGKRKQRWNKAFSTPNRASETQVGPGATKVARIWEAAVTGKGKSESTQQFPLQGISGSKAEERNQKGQREAEKLSEARQAYTAWRRQGQSRQQNKQAFSQGQGKAAPKERGQTGNRQALTKSKTQFQTTWDPDRRLDWPVPTLTLSRSESKSSQRNKASCRVSTVLSEECYQEEGQRKRRQQKRAFSRPWYWAWKKTTLKQLLITNMFNISNKMENVTIWIKKNNQMEIRELKTL